MSELYPPAAPNTVQTASAVGSRLRLNSAYVTARQQFSLRQRLNTVPTASQAPGMFIGNSIINGGWPALMLAKIATATGRSSSEWTSAVPVYGVGGAQLSQAAFLLAPQALNPSGAYGDARVWAAKPNPLMAGKRWVIIGGARNETPDLNTPGFVKAFRVLLEGMVDLCHAAGADVIMLTDPIQVDTATGKQSQLSRDADPVFSGIQRDVAAARGCTLVDEYQYSLDLYNSGVDLRQYMPDGTHPGGGENGTVNYREIIAQHVYDAVMVEPLQPAPARGGTLGAGILTVNWAPGNGTTTTTTAYSRQAVTGTADVRTLAPGASITLSGLMGYAWSNLLLQPNAEGINLSISAVTATSQAAGAGVGSTNHREQTRFIYNSSPFTPSTPAPAFTNNTGQNLELVGMLYAGPISHGQVPLRVGQALASNGTWTDATHGSDGYGVAGPDLDGAWIEFEFFGTGIMTKVGRGPAAPIYDFYVDGVKYSSATADAYATSASVAPRGQISGLDYGRHVLRIVVNGRNAASTGVRDIRIAGLLPYDQRSQPAEFMLVAGDRGLTGEANAFYTPFKILDARITRVLTGSPVLTVDSATGRLEVKGGAAIVQVTR